MEKRLLVQKWMSTVKLPKTLKLNKRNAALKSAKGSMNEVRFPGFLHSHSHSVEDCLKKWLFLCITMCELLKPNTGGLTFIQQAVMSQSH